MENWLEKRLDGLISVFLLAAMLCVMAWLFRSNQHYHLHISSPPGVITTLPVSQ